VSTKTKLRSCVLSLPARLWRSSYCDRSVRLSVCVSVCPQDNTNALMDVVQTRWAWVRGDPEEVIKFGVDPIADMLFYATDW